MKKEQRIQQIRGLARSNQDAITMIMCALADKSSSRGLLISVAQFDAIADMIIEYFGLEEVEAGGDVNDQSAQV